MKKFLFVLIILIPALAWSQEPTPKKWEWTGITGLNLNQASFSNWTAGGINSVAFSALGKYTGNYTKNKLTWKNNLNLMYGMYKEKDKEMTKNEDVIELISVIGHDLSEKWAITGYMSFRSQFANGYDQDFDTMKISQFLAPGYLTLSPSARYSPGEHFYLLLSPVTAKFTFVMDQDLANLGSFGVNAAEYDNNGIMTKEGEQMLLYLGPFIEAYFKKEVAKNLTYESRFNILYTFINRDNLEAYDMDISWENFLNYNFAKYFSVNLFLHFLYLPGQPIIKFETTDGVTVPSASPNRHIQVKETLGIGLSYSFPSSEE